MTVAAIATFFAAALPVEMTTEVTVVAALQLQIMKQCFKMSLLFS
jgi:hypothetical protein